MRIVTQNKYKFNEQPPSQGSSTPARYNSRNNQRNSHPTSRSHSSSDPYRYTYSYPRISSGRRNKRTSHFVHKLKITVPRNLTARDNILVLTPVLESLQKLFHYEIVKGNHSLFGIKVEEGISALYAKHPLNIGLHRVYLKGKLDSTKIKIPIETDNQIEFTGSGDEMKEREKSKAPEMSLNKVVGVSEARKFHLDIIITVE